jgi:hypothetical protein
VLGAVELPLGERQLPLFDPDGTDTRPLVLGERRVETPTCPVVRLAPARHGTECLVSVWHPPRETRLPSEFECLPVVVGRRVEIKGYPLAVTELDRIRDLHPVAPGRDFIFLSDRPHPSEVPRVPLASQPTGVPEHIGRRQWARCSEPVTPSVAVDT